MTQDSTIPLTEEAADELLAPLAEKLTDLGLSFLLVVQGQDGRYHGNSSPLKKEVWNTPLFFAEIVIRTPALFACVKDLLEIQEDQDDLPGVPH